MKFSLFLPVIALLVLSQAKHLVPWEANRKLTWNDFQGKPRENSSNAALTSSTIDFRYGYGSSGFNYSITCHFDKSTSWARVKTPYILAHEQGHFDVAEIHARLLKKKLSEYKYRESSVDRDVNSIYEQVMDAHHQMQQDYDQETDNSRRPEQQQTWEKKIADTLRSLSAYANYK